VIALEPDLRIRTANQAAGSILGEGLDDCQGRSFAGSARPTACCGSFSEACRSRLAAAETEWREQLVFRSRRPSRDHVRLHAAAPRGRDAGGYVLVFDEHHRHAPGAARGGWGEVARRLAHEIKNPLTPIRPVGRAHATQADAGHERARCELLDRGTETIVQQVEA